MVVFVNFIVTAVFVAYDLLQYDVSFKQKVRDAMLSPEVAKREAKLRKKLLCSEIVYLKNSIDFSVSRWLFDVFGQLMPDIVDL